VVLNTQKEEFSYAYVYAVTAAASYSFQIAPRPLDAEGVDVILTGLGPSQSTRRPRLDVQIKCTSIKLLDNEIIRYPLEVKNYEELRLENPFVPRILIIVLVPDSQEDWLRQSQQELSLRHCGYWASLRGLPPTQNQNTVTVQVPTQNIFNTDALKTLMQRIESGELL
jgi:Domain of unknown function (DUF4365)